MTNPKLMTPANANKRKKGFTLTEIAIVLGIIGLILGAIWVAAASVYQNQRTGHADTAILQIAQGVRTLYATTSTITVTGGGTDMTTDLIAAKVIPSDLANTTAGTAIDPWAGGATKVLTGGNNDNFTVQMDAIPQASCIALLTAVGGSARDQSLFAAGSTTASAPVSAATAGTALPLVAGQMLEITPSAATAACSSVTSNVVQFGFGLK